MWPNSEQWSWAPASNKSILSLGPDGSTRPQGWLEAEMRGRCDPRLVTLSFKIIKNLINMSTCTRGRWPPMAARMIGVAPKITYMYNTVKHYITILQLEYYHVKEALIFSLALRVKDWPSLSRSSTSASPPASNSSTLDKNSKCRKFFDKNPHPSVFYIHIQQALFIIADLTRYLATLPSLEASKISCSEFKSAWTLGAVFVWRARKACTWTKILKLSKRSKAIVNRIGIPDICHEPHEHIRVNFFWPV